MRNKVGLCSIMLAAHLVSHCARAYYVSRCMAPVHAGGSNEKAGIETNHSRVAATDIRLA